MLKRHYGCLFFWRLKKLLVHLYQEIKNIKVMEKKKKIKIPTMKDVRDIGKPGVEFINPDDGKTYYISYFNFDGITWHAAYKEKGTYYILDFEGKDELIKWMKGDIFNMIYRPEPRDLTNFYKENPTHLTDKHKSMINN
jgi:hypothetical protein